MHLHWQTHMAKATAMVCVGQRDHPAWQSAANDVNAKDARMKAICGGG